MTVSAAQPGDLFILLTPTAQAQTITPTWQKTWQARYGGQCTQPLHASLQRFSCTDPAQLTMLVDALQRTTVSIKAIPLVGIALQPLLSGFRQNTILKCRLQHHTALSTLATTIREQLTQHDLIPDFPWYPELVTVLEDIDPLPADEIRLHAPQPLFMGSQLVLSRVVARNTYTQLWQWQLFE